MPADVVEMEVREIDALGGVRLPAETRHGWRVLRTRLWVMFSWSTEEVGPGAALPGAGRLCPAGTRPGRGAPQGMVPVWPGRGARGLLGARRAVWPCQCVCTCAKKKTETNQPTRRAGGQSYHPCTSRTPKRGRNVMVVALAARRWFRPLRPPWAQIESATWDDSQ